MNKEAQELAAVINEIGFDDGVILPAGAPVAPTPEPEPVKPAGDAKPTPEPEPEPKVEPEPEPEPAGDAKPTPEPEPVEPAGDKPAIPDSHYRAALHMGWKAEEVGELYDQNPALALKTLAKCYEQVNISSKQLGEIGTQARRMREAAPVAPVQPSRKEAVRAMLKRDYEDSPALEALVDLIPDAPVPQPVVKPVQQQLPERSIDEEIAVRQQINTFFGADEMKPYEEFYGTTSQAGDWTQLTPGQVANRRETCNRAQLILDGAEATGMKMSAAEALERAHFDVAAPVAEQVIRTRIVKSVQKRAAGVTLKPSGSKTPALPGSYNKDQAVNEMKEEFNKVSW